METLGIISRETYGFYAPIAIAKLQPFVVETKVMVDNQEDYQNTETLPLSYLRKLGA
jgi:hypothetical protein